jgi:ribosomal protein L29
MAAKVLSYGEILKTPVDELERDIPAKQREIAALKMNVKLGKEKDTAKVRRAKKTLAKMKLALHTLKRSR